MSFVLGYLVAFIGFFVGFLCTMFLIKENLKINSFLLGFTGGLLISFASFELIPVAIKDGGVWLVIFFMTMTTIFIAILESRFNFENININRNNFFKTSVILGFGIGLHNLPEGFALGSLYNGDFSVFKSFALVIVLHCIPESIALSIFLVKSKFSKKHIFLIISILSTSMGAGTYLGSNLFKVFESVMPISISIASASMIYVACGEIIPNSKYMAKGVIPVLGSMLGFVMGILILNIT